MVQGLGHDLHSESGCLFSNGHGQSLGTDDRVVEAGDHVSGQVDLICGVVVVIQGELAAGHVQLVFAFQILRLGRRGRDGDMVQGLGHDLHSESGCLFSNGHGQSLETDDRVVEAGDHDSGQVDLIGGAVVVIQGHSTAGHVQSVLAFQILRLGRQRGDGDMIQRLGDDFNLEGGRLFFERHRQGLGTDDRVVEAGDHVSGQVDLICGVVVVIQGELAAGHVQLVFAFQILRLGRRGRDGDMVQGLGHDLHSESGCLFSNGHGQSLGTDDRVVEAGDHVSGQVDLICGVVVVIQGHSTAGHVQLVLAFQILRLGRQHRHGDVIQRLGDDFNLEGGRFPLVGHGQDLPTDRFVVKALDRFGGQVDHFAGIVIVIQSHLAAGHVQIVLAFQILRFGRQRGDLDMIQSLGHDLYLKGSRLFFKRHRQGLGADDGVVEAANHVSSQHFFLHDIIVVVGRNAAAGDVQSILLLQIGQLLRQCLHLNGVN